MLLFTEWKFFTSAVIIKKKLYLYGRNKKETLTENLFLSDYTEVIQIV